MIESKVNTIKELPACYPIIKSYSKYGYKFTVLFIAKNTGIVIDSKSPEHPIGDYETDWAEYDFEKTPNEIILRNK